MVSSMSLISFLMPGSEGSTRALFSRSTGVPYLTMDKTMEASGGGPIAQQGRQVGDSRALAGADIETAGGNPRQQAETGRQAEQFTQAKAGVEMISGTGGYLGPGRE